MARTIEKKTQKSGSRTYVIDGREYPSVTTILSAIGKPALITWAANEERAACIEAAADLYEDIAGTPAMSRMVFLSTLDGRIGKVKAHKRASAKACEIGSQVHAAIELQHRKALGQAVGPEPKLSDEAMWAFMAWQDWALAGGIKPVFIEQTIWSPTHAYAGTMDLLAWVNGQLTLVDYKTSKGIYPEYKLQVAAYIRAMNEMGHGPITRGAIVRLPKATTDPAFEVLDITEDEIAPLCAVFDHVHQLYLWSAANEAERLGGVEGEEGRGGGGMTQAAVITDLASALAEVRAVLTPYVIHGGMVDLKHTFALVALADEALRRTQDFHDYAPKDIEVTR